MVLAFIATWTSYRSYNLSVYSMGGRVPQGAQKCISVVTLFLLHTCAPIMHICLYILLFFIHFIIISRYIHMRIGLYMSVCVCGGGGSH